MSKPTKILGIKMMKATATGKRYNQHNSINWSYLILGKVALNQTNIKQNTHVFIPNINDCKLMKESLTNNSGIL